MAWAIIDTNVYIGHWERGLFAEGLAQVRQTFIVRHSSVVLSELRRGARSPGARARVESLAKTVRTAWAPFGADWWEAGELIREVGDQQDWEVAKRREFQNDALIALTARRYGATVVTENQVDFALLAQRVSFSFQSV